MSLVATPGLTLEDAFATMAVALWQAHRDIPFDPNPLGSVTTNELYYGDNLDVLLRHVKDESVDLVYLDPPFNSAKDYNVLFKGKDGTKA